MRSTVPTPTTDPVPDIQEEVFQMALPLPEPRRHLGQARNPLEEVLEGPTSDGVFDSSAPQVSETLPDALLATIVLPFLETEV